MWATLLTLCAPAAHAKPLGWFRDGASDVTVPDHARDLPLIRGPLTGYLPAVAARLTVAIDEPPRQALVVVDLAGGWSRVSIEAANTLGIAWSFTRLRGEYRRVATLPRMELGGVVLESVRIEVVPDAPGLVLGLAGIDELATALLHSEGVLRVAPARKGAALVQSVGEPIRVSRQRGGRHRAADGTQRHGDGVTLLVPGVLRWGPAEAEGTFHLQTDDATSLVASSPRLPEPVLRAGTPHRELSAKLGDVWLAQSWFRHDDDRSDRGPNFWGAIGHDLLVDVDLAVYPAGRTVAVRPAPNARWQGAAQVAVRFALERFVQEEERAPANSSPSAVIRDRHLSLANTLWVAGARNDALPHYSAAAQAAGDHCGTHLRLAERRLVSAGTLLADNTVAAQIFEPLERAARLWDAWERLGDETRALIVRDQDRPGSTHVVQSQRCRRATRLLAAVHRLRGDVALAAETERELGAGRGRDRIDATVSRAHWAAQEGDEAMFLARVFDVTGMDSDHPLTAAFGLAEATRSLPDRATIGRQMTLADSRWIPGQLVHSLLSGTPPPPWDPAIERRSPGSPQVLCQRAVHLALSGNVPDAIALLSGSRMPALADWWTAWAVVHHLGEQQQARDEALLNVRLRFPLVPAGGLGL